MGARFLRGVAAQGGVTDCWRVHRRTTRAPSRSNPTTGTPTGRTKLTPGDSPGSLANGIPRPAQGDARVPHWRVMTI